MRSDNREENSNENSSNGNIKNHQTNNGNSDNNNVSESSNFTPNKITRSSFNKRVKTGMIVLPLLAFMLYFQTTYLILMLGNILYIL